MGVLDKEKAAVREHNYVSNVERFFRFTTKSWGRRDSQCQSPRRPGFFYVDRAALEEILQSGISPGIPSGVAATRYSYYSRSSPGAPASRSIAWT